jgi:hypothetical protein
MSMIETIGLQKPALCETASVQSDVVRLLAALVSLGVAEAKRLEERLADSLELGH